jgi:GNAT superfamily N-acetyltransferase
MNPPVALRPAERGDLDALLALYLQLNPDDADAPRAGLPAIFERILANAAFEIVVAESAGRLVATCYLNLIPNLSRGGRPYAVVENVVVDAAWRGRGIGRQVVRHALARAWAAGCYKALLQTGSRDAAVHAFYAACGFSKTDKTGFVARP